MVEQKSGAAKEYMLHKHCSPHPNVVKFIAHGEDPNYYWIAMEFCAGGDLFDKIEPDYGVDTDVAHMYFRQLLNGVSFLHSKGVAHRDIKPENIFLSEDGNLKIGDFGFATLFRRPSDGSRRQCNSVCGSPPYVAPEVLKGVYDADRADIWSCGIVLYVLLRGNTPWCEPVPADVDFRAYAAGEDSFKGMDHEVSSLIKGMLKIDPETRFSMDMIRQHVWVRRRNPLLGVGDDNCKDPIELASRLIQGLRINLKPRSASTSKFQTPRKSQLSHRSPLSLKKRGPVSAIPTASQPIFNHLHTDHHASTLSQPPVAGPQFTDHPSVEPLTQPLNAHLDDDLALNVIALDPTQAQFAGVSATQSMTQVARKFRDLIPQGRFTRFYSSMPPESLISTVHDALTRIGARTPSIDPMVLVLKHKVAIPFVASDRRRMNMRGQVRLAKVDSKDFIRVEFIKSKGDPLEWRWLFKRVVQLCEDCVYVAGN